MAGQRDHFNFSHGLQLFGIDHSRLPGQRNRAAGVTRAAATRHDGQPQVDAALDQARHFNFSVRRQHHKRIFNPPIGCVGDVRYARQAVKFNVVFLGQLAQAATGQAAQVIHFFK